MTEQQLELLSAFFDGEAAEPTAVAKALEDPGAIEALREFARLRVEVTGVQVAPPPQWVAKTRAALAARAATSLWGQRIPIPAAALAAGIAMFAVLGAWGWRVSRPSHVAPDRPPEVSRTLAFELGKDWQEQPADR